MLKIKKLSECMGKKVFTDSGDYFGSVDGINLEDNRIDGWRLVVARNSSALNLLGGARGIIVPHQFIRSIGDVFIVSKNAIPIQPGSDEDMSVEDDELM
jgi:sporulation protein YlmC with PRC-barrel domain